MTFGLRHGRFVCPRPLLRVPVESKIVRAQILHSYDLRLTPGFENLLLGDPNIIDWTAR